MVVVAQKIVSKAEGAPSIWPSVRPSAAPSALAAEVGKDPRLVEVDPVRESTRVVRSRPNLLIMQHRLGFVMANAGIDQSNVAPQDGHRPRPAAAARPGRLGGRDPHCACRAIRARAGVIISDSFGRPWRRGTAGVAIGAAGLPSLIDLRGRPDLFGRTLEVSIIGFADEIAAAASLLQGQAAEASPVVVVRGLEWIGTGRLPPNWCGRQQEDLFQ